MNSALYRDIGRADRQFAAVGDRKLAASVTLSGVAICMILANVNNVGPVQQPVAPRADAPAVRIVDPAFCKDQTWPYIDARCLKRVDKAEQPAADQRRADPQISAADVSAKVLGANANSPVAAAAGAATTDGAGTPAPSPAAGTLALPITPQAAPAAGDAGASRATEIRRDAANVPADVFSDQRLTDVSQPHVSRHWRRHSRLLFGFRF